MVQNEITIAGGGLAGAVAAITAAGHAPGTAVTWLVAESEPLEELSRTGSDQRLITRLCDDPSELLPCFPRGGNDVLPEFYAFGPQQTLEWCQRHALEGLTRENGTLRLAEEAPPLAAQLTALARRVGVNIRTEEKLVAVEAKPQGGFWITVTNERTVQCQRLILAGDPLNTPQAARAAESLGHTVERPVPSLFNFLIDDPLFKNMRAERVKNVLLSLPALGLDTSGPLELHPWGLAGEAVLALSSRAARELVQPQGQALRINWCGPLKVSRLLEERVRLHPRQRLVSEPVAELPDPVWAHLLTASGLDPDRYWGQLKKPELRKLKESLELTELHLTRKKLASPERAICGGVERGEIDFETMASLRSPGLYLAGDIVDVDGFAGGPHRQWHWTSGHAAGLAVCDRTRH
ncbi:aminoacetone oxidase family FAD-binding enzyme [Ruficoccus amylovorans]|uniref:Aminoacetone oxidase family FAD-binding enzyme n=1 Tax=Ruficoccus amylovorans TaxID=1804625 RepID=A0A842HDY9_9BACT|nr:aminoacetone oxidase family FAD-binding enzyme [Ruficoccus amylovorans]MBC2594775.1 aminoacetone oxidase family FAD-binding enzyme [Ruficoccus amylovorans]